MTVFVDNPRIEFLFDPDIRAVSDHFTNIMQLSRESLFGLIKVTNERLLPRAREIHSPVAIFIDNIDEYFKAHIIAEKLRRSDVGEVDPNIWYFSQIGLVEAVYQLQRINHHIKVFCSIRKEAYLRIRQFDDMYQQYEGSSVDVKYSKPDLYEIFVKNIRKEPPLRLVAADELPTKPLRAFLGLETIKHSLSGEEEGVFDYIHRHTLQRPRDFMSIGARISELDPKDRTEDNLKALINRTASQISYVYANEVLPHLSISNFDRLLSLIDSNVLTVKRLHQICSRYNGVSCYDSNCKQCVNVHVFCDLFKSGLLGCKKRDLTLNRVVQEFVLPGERTFDPQGVLPESTHYFVHPVLFDRIGALNPDFQDNISPLIVGYDRPWTDEGKLCSDKSIVYVACHPDDEVLSSGALLSHMTKLGCRLTIIWLSGGEHSSSNEASSRRQEAQCVSARLEASCVFVSVDRPELDLKDGQMDKGRIMAGIEKTIRDLRPDVVIWPFGSDETSQHQDHVALHKAMLLIMSRSNSTTTCWLSSQPPVDLDKEFQPTIFFPYDDPVFLRKLELFREYKSELSKPFAQEEAITDVARLWRKAGKFDMPYVEAYRIERGIPFKGLFPNS